MSVAEKLDQLVKNASVHRSQVEEMDKVAENLAWQGRIFAHGFYDEFKKLAESDGSGETVEKVTEGTSVAEQLDALVVSQKTHGAAFEQDKKDLSKPGKDGVVTGGTDGASHNNKSLVEVALQPPVVEPNVTANSQAALKNTSL